MCGVCFLIKHPAQHITENALLIMHTRVPWGCLLKEGFVNPIADSWNYLGLGSQGICKFVFLKVPGNFTLKLESNCSTFVRFGMLKENASPSVFWENSCLRKLHIYSDDVAVSQSKHFGEYSFSAAIRSAETFFGVYSWCKYALLEWICMLATVTVV